MKKSKISHWNYRVFKRIDNNFNEEYSIIEVYYDLSGKPVGYTDYQIPWGESSKELKYDISMILKACRHPELTEEDFKMKRKKHVRPKLDK